MSNSDSSANPDVKDFLKVLLGGSKSEASSAAEPKRNLLGELANLGANLKGQARAAMDEFRQHMIAVRRSAPLLRVKVQPSDDDSWLSEPAAAARVQALLEHGFTPVGVFRMDGIPNYAVATFIQPATATEGGVARTSNGITLELGRHFPDGNWVEMADSPAPKGVTNPPWLTRHHHPELPPADLINALNAIPSAQPAVPISPEGLPKQIEDNFHRIQCWRAERGGWTIEEVKRQRGLTDDTEVTEELQLLRHENAERWLTNWLRLQTDLPFVVDDLIESLVIVHDDLPPDILGNVWWCGTGDFDVRSDDFEEGAPRDVFERINQQRGEPLMRVWQKQTPLKADFYLPQERPRRIAVRSELGDALNEGLTKGDLRRALFAVASSEFESGEDAEAICQALALLKPDETTNLARQTQAVARLFQQVPDRNSAAFRHLQQHGIPHLLRLFDQIHGSEEEDAADKLLLIAKTLARYESTEGVDKIIEAARKPLNPEGMAWAGIFLQFKPEHPHRARVFAELSEPLPDGFIAVALLDAANALSSTGDVARHPFDSVAGKQRLRAWLEDTEREHFSYAHSAIAALPFLSELGRAELFAVAAQHPDLGVRLEAAAARAKTGDAEGVDQLVGFCGHWSSAQTAQKYLNELGREDLIPAASREPSFAALAEMSEWLAHPNELARLPDELEIVDHRELRWPPTRETKPFWLIRYLVRAANPDESD
ncbi:MAG TPA: hypothetical protein DCE44_06495, partial [Verrucomicrobiales bacterium]|nr:hypothetical protein [Verrucomicrobiales bacterium]